MFKRIIIVIILILFISSVSFADDISEELSNENILFNSQEVSTEPSILPDISSKAAIVIDRDSKAVLYGKNINQKRAMASTTKIMTAILAIENCDLSEKATVSQEAVDSVPSGYTNAGLIPGETFTVKDLLYALMLASANEAANVLAEHISGSVEEFAVLMTDKAKELRMRKYEFYK